MSKFRELIEDIVKPEQSNYVYLTPILQQALIKEIEKAMDNVDISELPSAFYDPNPYGVESQLVGTSGSWFLNNENDLWNAACDLVLQRIKADGVENYLWDYLTPELQNDEELQQDLTKEAIDYIEKQER